MLEVLKKRACELNIWNEYRTHKNNAGHTAFAMLDALYSPQVPKVLGFQNILDFADRFLGGEEINKVPCTNFGQAQVMMARDNGRTFYGRLTQEVCSEVQVKEMSQLSL